MSEQPSMQEVVESAQTILGDLLRLLEFEDARLETAVDDGQIFFPLFKNHPETTFGGDFETPTDWSDPLIAEQFARRLRLL